MSQGLVQRKLRDAEKKANDLRQRLQEIDRELGAMTPAEAADPWRRELKAEKLGILPRYRRAKANVKNLRIRLNSLPAEEELLPGVPVVEDVEEHNVLLGAYEVLSHLVDRHKSESTLPLEESDIEKAEDFLAWWEHGNIENLSETG